MFRAFAPTWLALWAVCAMSSPSAAPWGEVLETRHAGEDDLVSAGLGLAGLRAVAPPPPADPAAPTSAELRRAAIHANWRGIADLSPQGGFGATWGALPRVEGREFSALATLPGARHPHRVLLQLPDGFDVDQPCVLIAPASGSRGVYGAIALAAPWALPRGCAVVYTDKGAGTGYFDHASGEGVALDGRLAGRDAVLEFAPQDPGGEFPWVSMKHAHSGDLPERDWGRHTLQALDFALAMLDRAYPQHAPFTAANTRVLAAGLSNGAAAVLRAAELDQGQRLAGAVAAAANITVAGQPTLYDYAAQAALLQPCLLADADFARGLPMAALPAARAFASARCARLADLGRVSGDDDAARAADARAQLEAAGWTRPALEQAAVNVGLDLWRAVLASYASSYLRRDAANMPCGYRIAVAAEDGQPLAASRAERAQWWATSGGIAPVGRLRLLDPPGDADDPMLAGLSCLEELARGPSAPAEALQQVLADLRVEARIGALPTVVIHGLADGLIPEAFSSGPWVRAARARGAERLAYWRIARVQHFDAFLGLPDFSGRYLPLLPYVWAALDQLLAALDGRGGWPVDADIEPGPPVAPLTLEQLAIPPAAARSR